MPAGWKRSQWLFLADQTVDPHDAWLLAVHLEGPAEAIDWVDPDADVGAIMSLRHAHGEPGGGRVGKGLTLDYFELKRT